MKNLFNDLKIEISDNELKAFDTYYRLLNFYNNKFNITAITEKSDVYIKNFIDSILFLDEIKGETLIDIGSGGGFPALPIKIMKPSLKVTMIEATGKKCEFLSAVVKELNLKDVNIINGRAEDYAKDKNFREKFDICTARAVARLNMLTEYCLPFVKLGGNFIAFKAKATEEISESENGIKILGGKIEKTVNKNLYDNERTAVIIKKIQNTDMKYPRENGKIRKKPL